MRKYEKDRDKKVKLLNMAYGAVYVLATSTGQFTRESFNANDSAFHEDYQKMFAALTGRSMEELKANKPTSAVQDMVNLYNYLFS